MKYAVQNKINELKILAKESIDSNTVTKNPSRIVNDNLSKSIRNERDAKIFRKELNIAFELTKDLLKKKANESKENSHHKRTS